LSGLFFVLWLGLSAATFVFTQSIQPMLSLILFGALYLLSFPCSESLTKRHIEIGNEQMEIIGHKYKPELREQIEAIGEQKK
jgi:hypothetical protein